MTLRELISDAIDLTKNLDSEVKVRIVRRDQVTHVVKTVRKVRITRTTQFSDVNVMEVVIEQSDLDAAKEESP